MMKKLLLIPITILSIQVSKAQTDTLLYENFDVDPTASYALFNSGNDTVWVDFDADALPDANMRPQEWYWSDAGFATVDENDGCMYSSSWLQGFLPGNRNWLITPPIYISDANAILSWASAPYQTPRYVDGYTVLVSTTDNIETSFTDTLFQAASFLSGSGSNFNDYMFTPGFVHGMDGTYIEFSGDSGAFLGEQRPFSVNLAAYAGQSIYIAFLHDSDDDNLISLDDIMVTGTLVGLNEHQPVSGLSVYPNPAFEKLELDYYLDKTSPIVVEVYDVIGNKVLAQNRGIQIFGNQKLTIDVSDLASGAYAIVLYANGKSIARSFVKE